MKLKNLRKKIRRLEKRLREGPKKLVKLRRKLEAMEAEKALKGAKRSAAHATVPRPIAKPSTSVKRKSPTQTAGAKKPGIVKKAKKKLHLSQERRAQLAAAMKARWAAKRAAEADAKTASASQDFRAEPTPQAPESGDDAV
jgi:hypothetical protein